MKKSSEEVFLCLQDVLSSLFRDFYQALWKQGVTVEILNTFRINIVAPSFQVVIEPPDFFRKAWCSEKGIKKKIQFPLEVQVQCRSHGIESVEKYPLFAVCFLGLVYQGSWLSPETRLDLSFLRTSIKWTLVQDFRGEGTLDILPSFPARVNACRYQGRIALLRALVTYPNLLFYFWLLWICSAETDCLTRPPGRTKRCQRNTGLHHALKELWCENPLWEQVGKEFQGETSPGGV